MILVTVGTQTPFDRLVHAVDAWAERSGRTNVVAQVGATERPPRCIEWRRFIEPAEFRALVHEADAVVTHAGMGTIITAMEFSTPLIVMPRRGLDREARNDHQRDTALALRARAGLTVAWDADELNVMLDALPALPAPPRIASHASPELLTAVRAFIRGDASLPLAETSPGAIPMRVASAEERRRAA